MPPLKNMLSACWRPVEHYIATSIEIIDGRADALLWHKDLKQHAAGDFSIAVVQANETLEDQSQVQTGRYGTYVGVYDGHGGPEASRFITDHLFSKIEKFAQEQGRISTGVLKKAVSAVEEEFLGLVDQYWPFKPSIATVGSCCLVGVISGNKLFAANLGDSRVVLGTSKKNRGVFAVRLSKEHNASIEEVREELRVQHPDDPHIVVLKHGVWRVKGIIQISRSIGDAYLKKPELNRNVFFSHLGYPVPLEKPVLTAEPSLLEHTLCLQDRFLIFASDGLWEQLSDQEAVNVVHNNPRMGIAKKLVQTALHVAAKKRELRYSDLKKIEQGVRRHFHDDISVVVVYVDHNFMDTKQRNLPRIGGITADSVNSPIDVFSFNSLENSPKI